MRQTIQASRLLIDGKWVEGQGDVREVTNPYDGSVIGAVPLATPEEVERAVAAADRAFATTAAMPAHERAGILYRASELVARDREEIARTIAMEAGKALKFARAEADRGVQTFRFAAEEARRLNGETVPMDAVPGAERRMGFWFRVPRGPVAAISPFNFPLNLLAHKVAPALAAGNTLVVKPPSPRRSRRCTWGACCWRPVCRTERSTSSPAKAPSWGTPWSPTGASRW